MDDALRNSELLQMIRAKVRQNLTKSAAFNELSAEKRAEIAHHTVNAMQYILGGADGTSHPNSVTVVGPAPIARELAEKQRPDDPAGDTASARLGESGAVAAQQGSGALADLVNRVDFPAFVAGLIDGVFNAIVH